MGSLFPPNELFLLRIVGYPGSLSIQVKTARNVTAARHRLADQAVKLVRDHGAEPASAAEMRQALRSSKDSS
jgi:hypothetical protein